MSLDTTNIGKCSTRGAVSTDTKNTAQCSGFGVILTTGEGSFRTRSARRRTRTAHSSIDTGCFRFILLRSIGQRKQNFECVSQDHVPDEGEVPGGSGQTRRDRGRGGLDNKRGRFNTPDEKNSARFAFHSRTIRRAKKSGLSRRIQRERKRACVPSQF